VRGSAATWRSAFQMVAHKPSAKLRAIVTSKEKIALWLRFKIWAPMRINRHSGFYSSHSQFGEDMVLRYLTADTTEGFYVDVGAHHPVYGSNTYHFYRRGWRGINIDASPGSIELLNLLRPRDVNIEACLSSREGEDIEYFMFDQGAFNTVSPAMALKAQAAGARLVATRPMRTTTLARLLERHLPAGVRIDLLNIDVEGLDEEILLSHDWNTYPARIVAFENPCAGMQEIGSLPVVDRLSKFGYTPVARCGLTIVLQRRADSSVQNRSANSTAPFVDEAAKPACAR
jgi:FkbM family methyltransferase